VRCLGDVLTDRNLLFEAEFILVSMVAVVSLGGLLTFGDQVKRLYCKRIMQIAFIDRTNAGELDIEWVPKDGEDAAYCFNNDAIHGEVAKLF
jgi:hypothetical protein